MASVADYRALISGLAWLGPSISGAPIVLTYSFAQAPPYYNEAELPGWLAHFEPVTSWERQETKRAIDAWAQVSGVTFIEVNGRPGDIVFSAIVNADSGDPNAAARGGYPSVAYYVSGDTIKPYGGEIRTAGDIVYSIGFRSHPAYEKAFYHGALHEIGHALGLKHPHDVMDQSPSTLDPDIEGSTVMSYKYQIPYLGPLDIAAVQYL